MNAAEHKKAYIEYLKAKVCEEDWHAVSDVANDLRELEARASAKPFLVEKGIKVSETEIDGRSFVEIRRG